MQPARGSQQHFCHGGKRPYSTTRATLLIDIRSRKTFVQRTSSNPGVSLPWTVKDQHRIPKHPSQAGPSELVKGTRVFTHKSNMIQECTLEWPPGNRKRSQTDSGTKQNRWNTWRGMQQKPNDRMNNKRTKGGMYVIFPLVIQNSPP